MTRLSRRSKTLVKAALTRLSVKPVLEQLCELEASIATRWASSTHRRLMAVQCVLPPQPENSDHRIDLFYQWIKTRNSLWLERGVFGGLALRGGDVLELACGDGFNARNFYSLRSRRVVACDFNPKAIATAKKKNSAPNIEYVLVDIRTAMPSGSFDNVVWDAAIEHFTPDEIERIIVAINSRLSSDGEYYRSAGRWNEITNAS